MHAKIELAPSITQVLRYNELKVRKGHAECLEAGNFIKDVNELSYRDKWYHFDRLIMRNEYPGKPVLHVFLRFNLADHLNNQEMARIAREYLEGMGYGDQPWLAYRHYDTLHAHAHLVSARIRVDGKRIVLSLKDLKYSRELTHGLEKKFGLDQRKEAELRVGQRFLQKVNYGKTSLYPAISQVLETVIPHYAFCSLADLNAVLGLFNIKVSRGSEESMLYQNRGLIYYPLTDNGKSPGIYIKASAFASRPTLDNLEKRFVENQSVQEQHRRRLTTTIDYALAGASLSFPAFQQAMAREKINLVVQQDAGGARAMWYVDHHTKTVFEGAALGAKYTEAGVLQRCIPEETYQRQQQVREEHQHQEHRIGHSF